MLTNDEIEQLIDSLKQSRKYGATHEATIRELVLAESGHYKKAKQVEKAVRKRLHSIMAPYLGDPEYERATRELTAVFATNDPAQIKACCHDLLHDHLSTRERLPILDDFYRQIFAVTGRPRSLLDIACGLNPLAYRWMGLAGAPEPVHFYAYDIHAPRIDLINHYFGLEGLPALARLQDVAIDPPQETADLALFLKELPRFARNYGSDLARTFLHSLNVRWLVVSFPTVSTHGGRSLVERYRDYFNELIDPAWPVTELLFDSELVMIAEKIGTRRYAEDR
jgi:16S rRNA (guanine(1405)-N(7))-methyltransferase